MRKKYNHLVDTNLKLVHLNTDGKIPASKLSEVNNKSQTLVMIYTTRHYFAALKITRYWKNFLAYRDKDEASLLGSDFGKSLKSEDSNPNISGSIHNLDAVIPES